MSRANEILQQARARAQQLGLPYSGALTPPEAHALLSAIPASHLVDVRSQAEWQFVGSAPDSVRIEWKTWPGMLPNAHFLEQLRNQVDAEDILLFICRSGARSHEAAALAAQNGFAECYNVLEGFEGDRDAQGQRGRTGGWKGHGLPWSQT